MSAADELEVLHARQRALEAQIAALTSGEGTGRVASLGASPFFEKTGLPEPPRCRSRDRPLPRPPRQPAFAPAVIEKANRELEALGFEISSFDSA